MIDPVNVLELFAEISIGFVGFAGIIATLRGGSSTTRSDAVGMSLIVVHTFGVALGSLLLLFLMSVGVHGSTLWAWSSGTIAFAFAVILTIQALGLRGSAAMRKQKGSLLAAFAIGSTVMVVNGLNAFGVVFHQQFWPVFATAIWGLALAAYFFSLMLLRPMWRSVRANEKARVEEAED